METRCTFARTPQDALTWYPLFYRFRCIWQREMSWFSFPLGFISFDECEPANFPTSNGMRLKFFRLEKLYSLSIVESFHDYRLSTSETVTVLQSRALLSAKIFATGANSIRIPVWFKHLSIKLIWYSRYHLSFYRFHNRILQHKVLSQLLLGLSSSAFTSCFSTPHS